VRLEDQVEKLDRIGEHWSIMLRVWGCHNFDRIAQAAMSLEVAGHRSPAMRY
jgi:hypothetical protein